MVIYPEKNLVWKDTCILMFTATLFIIAKTWKQPKRPSTEEWIKMWYIYTMGYYLAIKQSLVWVFESLLWRIGWQWPAVGTGALAAADLRGTCWHKSFGRSLLALPGAWRLQAPGPPQSKQITRQYSPTHWQKIGLKIHWAWPWPPEQTQFPHSQSLPWGSLHKPLILIIRRHTEAARTTTSRMKTTITES